MRRFLMIAGVAAALTVPCVAAAQNGCQRENHDNRVAGTIIGGVAGGLLGNALAHGGGKAGGTAIGAVGGAVVGHQIARANEQPCPAGYVAENRGWYDRDGRWCSWEDRPYTNDYGRVVDREVRICR